MYIIRERYLSKIRPFYDVDLIKVLTGVRRCGKSVLLTQIKDELIGKGIDEAHIIEVNFEDISFEKIRTATKLDAYIKEKIQDNDKYYIFLDEVQHVRNFEKVLTSFRATLNCSLFVTGSNSKMLSGKMASLLVGRCIEFRVMPFSFKEAVEYLQLTGKQVNPDELIYDYINWGGLPLRFSFEREADIKAYIEQTYHGIIDRDIITEKSKVSRQKFTKFSDYVMANAGKEFSSKSIETYFAVENDEHFEKKAIYRYLDKMEKACLISRVKRFNIVGKRAMSYVEKQYAVDTGFRMVNTNLVNFEDTFFLENIIFNLLIKYTLPCISETSLLSVSAFLRFLSGVTLSFLDIAVQYFSNSVAARAASPTAVTTCLRFFIHTSPAAYMPSTFVFCCLSVMT